jgi:hypothetical protein
VLSHKQLLIQLMFYQTSRAMLTYPLFIDEIRVLRADIDKLRLEPGLTESVPFRTWRHALSTLIDQMKRNGYPNIRCNVQMRSFHPRVRSTKHPANYFQDALHDTVIELDSLISNFEKYGDPNPLPTAAMPIAEERPISLDAPPVAPTFATLPKPGELTWAWVSTSVPFAYWYLAGAAVVTLLGGGFQAGDMWAGRRAAAAATEALQRPVPAAIAPGQAKPSTSRK